MALFPVTLSDHNYLKPPHFRHFVSLVISTWWVEIANGWQTIPERGVVRSRESFKFWWASTISLKRLKLQSLNFVHS